MGQVAESELRICLAASGGGHLSQLLKLKNSWDGSEVFFVTTTEVVRDTLCELGTVYVVGECNRKNPVKVAKVLWRCIRIMFSERADVVISTGAAVGCMICFLGKLRGAKVIWMDSITNVNRLSLSGRIVRRVADLFIVQWPELTEIYANTEYLGSVI